MRPPLLFAGVLGLAAASIACTARGAGSAALSGTAAGVTSAHLKPNLQVATPTRDLSQTMSGDASKVPQQTRPFLFTLPRQRFFDEWDGVLPTLADYGITPAFSYVSDSAGNVSGGIRRGASYDDNWGLALAFDLEKEFSLQGGSFLISMCRRDGDSLTLKDVGNTFNIQQVYGGETFHLIDIEYQQKLFDDKADVALGRLATGDDFLVSAYDYLFMQNGLDGNPVGIFYNAPGMFAYPSATWGARLRVRPSRRTYVMAGVYNGDATIRANTYNGANMSMHGPVFAIAEAGCRLNGLPGDSQYLGDYKIGGWYDDNLYTDYRTAGSSGAALSRRGNWGIYGLFDQVILPFAEPGSNRGLGIFGSILISPDQTVSEVPYFFTAGAVARGLFASRPRDQIGFAAIFGQFSNDLADSQERQQPLDPEINVQRNETALELTYRWSMTDGACFIQPDIQYIIHPGGTPGIGNAFVLGCQLGLNF